jgi:hypothetical protein
MIVSCSVNENLLALLLSICSQKQRLIDTYVNLKYTNKAPKLKEKMLHTCLSFIMKLSKQLY